MPLFSQLFQGDPALEAAADIDAAHIMQGARGEHVKKIQTALNTLDDARLSVDGIYGPGTAKAVLNYKTKRNIINQAYQTTADNIVGKMTMAKLDEEMKALETQPSGPIQIIPISPLENREKFYPRLSFSLSESLILSIAPTAKVLPSAAITLVPGDKADIEIKNGKGYDIIITSATYDRAQLAVLFVPGNKEPVTHFHMNVDTIRIQVKANFKWGTAILYAQNFKAPGNATEKLLINIQDNFPPAYHPSQSHHHEPVTEPDEWNKVCEEAEKDPDIGYTLLGLAKIKASPPTIIPPARMALAFNRMAQFHFDYYLNGAGGVVNEDDNIKRWIEGDSRARKVIAEGIRLRKKPTDTIVKFYFHFDQRDFDDHDARNSFGSIDNLEVEANFSTGKVDVWFEDTYEWHPPYSQYTKPMLCPDRPDHSLPPSPTNARRDSYLGHAALVQMKTRGAQDFQMRGKATFDMKIFPGL